MRSAISTIGFVYVWLACAVAASAQEIHTVSFEGVVKTARGGRPDVPVRVRLQRLGVTVDECLSPDGRFQFRNVEAGPYTIVVDAAGYDAPSTRIELPGESFVAISLREKREKHETQTVDAHLLLAQKYFKKGKKAEMIRELELFVKEAPPSALRDKAEKALSDSK